MEQLEVEVSEAVEVALAAAEAVEVAKAVMPALEAAHRGSKAAMVVKVTSAMQAKDAAVASSAM